METDCFFLYLRSLASDLHTREEWRFSGSPLKLLDKKQTGTPKTALAYLLQPAGPMIEIGAGQGGGLGRLQEQDSEWWDTARAHIINATAIFVSPGMTEGLLQEIDFILASDKIARRSFVLMEPSPRDIKARAAELEKRAAADRITRWKAAASVLAERGCALPSYDVQGAIISLYDTTKRLSMIGLSRYELYGFLQIFYVDLTKLGSYDIEPREPCPCGSRKVFSSCHAPLRPDQP